MSIIRLDRPRNTLHIGENIEHIERFDNCIQLYDITHVVRDEKIKGWYELRNKEKTMGFITDVEHVYEQW